jgi:hypothetical protein
VRIDTRWATTNPAEIRRQAAELVALGPDVILSTGDSTVPPRRRSRPLHALRMAAYGRASHDTARQIQYRQSLKVKFGRALSRDAHKLDLIVAANVRYWPKADIRRTDHMERGRSSRSDWRDARKLYDLAPLLSFVGEESAKISGRARERRGAKLREPRMRLGIGENRVHRLVDLVDGLAG